MMPEHDRAALRPDHRASAGAVVGQATIPPGHPWNRIPVIGAVSALVGGGACAILGASNPKQFFFSLLVSCLFFLSLALGALFFVLIQYASQGGWGIVLRRIGETTFATLPVMAALFVPVLLGVRDLYSWSIPGAAETEASLGAARHALETLATSERNGCALGAATALVGDWWPIRRLLDRAAARVGAESPSPSLPSPSRAPGCRPTCGSSC